MVIIDRISQDIGVLPGVFFRKRGSIRDHDVVTTPSVEPPHGQVFNDALANQAGRRHSAKLASWPPTTSIAGHERAGPCGNLI